MAVRYKQLEDPGCPWETLNFVPSLKHCKDLYFSIISSDIHMSAYLTIGNVHFCVSTACLLFSEHCSFTCGGKLCFSLRAFALPIPSFILMTCSLAFLGLQSKVTSERLPRPPIWSNAYPHSISCLSLNFLQIVPWIDHLIVLFTYLCIIYLLHVYPLALSAVM